ncbi:MAG: bifunctional phosphopantothenoylcysteine decarboxylase/phosphopantothenate--cysteine ligase CoaBC [Victivallales bacterium]|nr:bifunctional phosphopantothenoylcysteine decarboxylase/phosphopantothenate--cysteine ligase CoaBC [Victivallales bacterium]
MKSVLLISETEASFFHTPRTIALLQDNGFDVTVASNSELLTRYARPATGKKPIPLMKEYSGFDVVLLAPYDCGHALPKTDAPLIVAPFITDNEKPPRIKKTIVLKPSDEAMSLGRLGKGRVASPEQCVEAVITAITPQDFKNRTILLTAGPTIEDADPARFISNRSTGRMGTAIAAMAARRGAKVILIHGPMLAPVPESPRVTPVPVRSAEQMCDAVLDNIEKADIAILCAAVADFAPDTYSEEKIKKGKSQHFTLRMHRTPDILATVGALPDKPFLVGFAAESNHIRNNALDKLHRKNCDMLCANDILAPGCGFATDTNSLLVFTRDGACTEVPLASKADVANAMLDLVLKYRGNFKNIAKSARRFPH